MSLTSNSATEENAVETSTLAEPLVLIRVNDDEVDGREPDGPGMSR